MLISKATLLSSHVDIAMRHRNPGAHYFTVLIRVVIFQVWVHCLVLNLLWHGHSNLIIWTRNLSIVLLLWVWDIAESATIASQTKHSFVIGYIIADIPAALLKIKLLNPVQLFICSVFWWVQRDQHLVYYNFNVFYISCCNFPSVSARGTTEKKSTLVLEIIGLGNGLVSNRDEPFR